MMNEEMKAYALEHWNEYNLTDTKEEFVALLNILESHDETLDSLHDVCLNGYSVFCDIDGRFEDDRDVVNTLFDFNEFYKTMEDLRKMIQECYVDDGEYESVEEFLETETIVNTSDGVVRFLEY